MAGSYGHVKNGWSLIENMGDAYEAVHELMWLVENQIGEHAANTLLKNKYYPIKRGELDADDVFNSIETMMGS